MTMEPLPGSLGWDAALAKVPCAVALVDAEWRIAWVNAAMAEFLDLPAERILGRLCHELVRGEACPHDGCPLRRMKESGRRESADIELPGREAWVRVTVDPVFDGDGRLAGALHLMTDITDERGAARRAALRARRQELLDRIEGAVSKNAGLGAVLKEVMRDLCSLLESPRCTIRLFGESEELIEHREPGFPSVYPVLLLIQSPSDWRGVYEAGHTVVVNDIREFSCYGGDLEDEGRRVLLGAFMGVPMRIRGELMGVLFLDSPGPRAWIPEEVAAVEDVVRYIATAVRHAEMFRTQQGATEQLLSLMNNVPGIVYRGIRNWAMTFVGRDVEELSGHAPEEFTGGIMSWESLVHPDDLDGMRRALSEALAAREKALHLEYRILRRDGTLRWVADRRQLRYDGQGVLAFIDGLLLDITDRKRAEEEGQAANERFRGLIQASPLAITAVDLEGMVTLWNPAAEHLFGWSEADVAGRPDPTVPDGKREELLALRERTLKGESCPGVETSGRRKDGSLVEIVLSTAPVRDAAGSVTGVMAVIADLNERKRIERALQQSEARLRQAQKMEAVGRLAGGVAHDFNNILTAIRGYSDMLLLRLEDLSPLRRDVGEIVKAGERAASLTQQLLAFSRRQVLKPQVIDLNEIVAGMENMLRRLIGEDIELVAARGPGLGRIRADPGQVEQVIMNLAVNARDAMPAGGRLTIETANVDLEGDFIESHPVMASGPYVMLAVSDTGSGMDKETQSRLFEPFFTTKEAGKGTGLGLATVYGIVKQSGGYIWVYSELGKGSTFKIYLPRVEGAPEAAVRARGGAKPARGRETVLVVEDEEMVRQLVCEILRRSGYTVLEAASGPAAMNLSGRCREPIHLLLTDMVMPVVSGRDLAEKLLPSRPGMKVLYMSGYTDEAIVRHGMLDGMDRFIMKPFSRDALLGKIREALDDGKDPGATPAGLSP